MIDLVKNPPHGYGKNLNPCIDCHGLMIKRAGEIARQENFDIVATGEVLGQRPFSQNKEALLQVDKIAGFTVLRPLSAKLLEETEYEKNGLIKRHKLLKIDGRSRDDQIDEAKRIGIKDIPGSAGGCLLTAPEFSERLGKLLDYRPDCDYNDIELLKNGRVYWFILNSGDRAMLLIGRDQIENQALKKLSKTGDIIIESKDDAGPTALLRWSGLEKITNPETVIDVPEILRKSEFNFDQASDGKEILGKAALITGWYGVKLRGKSVVFRQDLQ
jgi:hypothetical protein